MKEEFIQADPRLLNPLVVKKFQDDADQMMTLRLKCTLPLAFMNQCKSVILIF